MVVYVNIALTYCKLARWTPVLFCYKTGFTSIQSYLRCSSVWYPPHTRVKKSKRKSLTKYTDLAQSNSRYFTSYYMQYLCLPCLPIVCGDFTTTFRNPYAYLRFFNLTMFCARNFALKLAKMKFCVVILTNFEKVLLQPFTTTKFGMQPLLHAYNHQKKI